MSPHSTHHPTGAGKTSFGLIDTELFFNSLDLKPGDVFLDLACGRGVYILAIAERFGHAGQIIGVDLWPDGIAELNAEAQARGMTAVEGLVGDAGDRIPVADSSVDVLLIATALHDFYNDGIAGEALAEIKRVIKPRGRIVIIEFKKIDGPPGPPITSRLAPKEVIKLLEPYQMSVTSELALGAFTYLVSFTSS
jgi:ubiquinone/menaquinone biosynthesis C-methylase UbiE